MNELKRLQQCIDRIYRYVWSRKTKPPTRKMEKEHKNMADVRAELGVRSVRWKVEKSLGKTRTYNSIIICIMRMDDSRMTEAATLGWMEEFENYDSGSKR